MDNTQIALLVGFGSVVATASAGIVPAIFSYRLEKRRLQLEDSEHQRQSDESERAQKIALSENAIESLTEFLGYADRMSRGGDLTIAHNARSARMKALGQLAKYSVIASKSEIEAIRRFEQSSRKTLEESNSAAIGREVLESFLEESIRKSTLISPLVEE
jgi:hypothetical protein